MTGKETPEKPRQVADAAADTKLGRPKPPASPGTPSRPAELGGREGPEPTRYGDWEVKGICSDF
jgi:hypothetical protein